MYLLDTNVISALRRPALNPQVANWAAVVAADDLHISVATIAEIERGIARQRRRRSGFATELTDWLTMTISAFEERVLPIDTAVARLWGEISGTLGNNNPDLVIAATALVHGLTVVTRNVRDFLPTGVAVLDPFSGAMHPPA